MDLVGAFEWYAQGCAEIGSPMYGELLAHARDDVAAGGPVADLLGRHSFGDPVEDAVPLRLAGSVHRLVLEGRAPQLAAFYPSVGGSWVTGPGWREFRRLVAERPDEVAEWLDRPPQTNEVGRAAALYGALLQLPRGLPVRLMEIGASAGLNLRADRFCYLDHAGRIFGAADSPLRLDGAWQGRPLEPWPELEVLDREGCDLRPVDAASEAGRVLLTAYVWPDQQARLERLRSALAVAGQVPVRVRRRDAVSFLSDLDLQDGATTVVWHSIMWQYMSAADQQAVTDRLDELGGRATPTRRLAHVAVEPGRREPDMEFRVSLQTWPAGEGRVIGHTVAHGVPTTWE